MPSPKSDGARTALITGGASGLGLAAARRLREDGLEVFTADINPGADFVVDVTDDESVRQLLQDVGQVDVLVNSAGIPGQDTLVWDTSLADWDRVFAVNSRGVFLMCREFVPGMRAAGWGRIVNIASLAGKVGNPKMAAYSASKAAVIALTKSLGKELATDGVLVNAIAPALFDTPLASASRSDERVAEIAGLIPMNRVGRPEEVAELISWLASDRVSFSTGAVYDISGGRATY